MKVTSSVRLHCNTYLQPLQVLAILYKGHKAAQEEPRLLGTVENQVSTLGSRRTLVAENKTSSASKGG
jgi:formate dehydrogenase